MNQYAPSVSLPWSHTRLAERPTTTVNRHLAYVEALLDIMTKMVDLMWKGIYLDVNLPLPPSPSSSMRGFIREVLKRSQTTWTTAQMAVQYLFQTQDAIRSHVQRHRGATIICCARRMFLASLIVASKFVQDKTYRNSAWATIARLPVQEVNLAERVFLELNQYQLYVSSKMYDDLHRVLCNNVAQALHQPVVSLQDVSFAYLMAPPATITRYPTQLSVPSSLPMPPQALCNNKKQQQQQEQQQQRPMPTLCGCHHPTATPTPSITIIRKRAHTHHHDDDDHYDNKNPEQLFVQPHHITRVTKRCRYFADNNNTPPNQRPYHHYHQTHSIRPTAPVLQFM
ncbi:hypothetical protein BX666DRAFT_499050 [Dichotomocladium elegans]|nr:hypothetical protein BX666DRAFT_499050 [Dichotomocladium elegans]